MHLVRQLLICQDKHDDQAMSFLFLLHAVSMFKPFNRCSLKLNCLLFTEYVRNRKVELEAL